MAKPEAQEPEVATLARSAMDAYRSALHAGQPEVALRWLERAHRLVPSDPNVALSLAGALSSREPARSAQLFDQVASLHDVREAWMGLAMARLRLGAADHARDALGRALARHVPHADTRTIATAIARASDAPGWCGVTFTGDLLVHTIARQAPVIMLDDRPVTGRRLPAGWARGHQVRVTVQGRDLIGSPIRVAAIRRTEGIVTADHTGVRGWAWHPADPGRAVTLRVSDARGRRVETTAHDASITVPDLGPLARPLGFFVPARMLDRLDAVLDVLDQDGRSLYGSPVAPLAALRSALATARSIARQYPVRGQPPRAHDDAPSLVPLPADLPVPSGVQRAGRQAAATAVIIPVHGQRALTLACIDSVLTTIAAPDRVIVIDDASPDPDLARELATLARSRRITVLRNEHSVGFAASVNRGLRASHGQDVVLLNSDTLVPPQWLERLRDAAYAAPDIGTVTPLSNDASILSYPHPAERNPAPDLDGTRRLDALVRKAAGSTTVEIPVGVGFCLFVRRDCLTAVGSLRDDVFAQGYGEENDFCLRARRLGWRHIALPSLFVAHQGGQSFNKAGLHLRSRNAALLERLHPGYDALIQAFIRADPLAPVRRTLDLRRWRGGRTTPGSAVVLITHDDAGGVEQRIRQSVTDHVAAGRTPIILRPTRRPDGQSAVEVGGTERFPNLRYAMPDEMPALLRWLRGQKPILTEVHHLLGHHGAVSDLPAALGAACNVHVHDYGWFCPRVVLVDGHGRYCGEPDIRGCEACVADHGRLDQDDTPVATLRARSATLLRDATRVIVPSNDTARRIERHFPATRVEVVPHQDDAAITVRPKRSAAAGRRWRVCVLGAIGVHKGYDVLLACARDAAARNLGLDYVVVGTTIDDARLLDTGRVFVTGAYEPSQAVDQVLRQDADLGFLPSIAPETWCLGLTELWLAGLYVAAFEIGAPAERIRNTGRGFLLPPHLPPGAINNALVNVMASSGTHDLSGARRNVPRSDPSLLAAKGP